MIRLNAQVILRIHNQRGQTLVVLLLILVVTLTIGLSAVSRSITNVRESSATERSTRAFTAAEAAVETTLRQDLSQLAGSTLDFDVGTGKSTVSVANGSTGNEYRPLRAIEKDDALQIVLDDSNPATATVTALTIYWTQSDAGEYMAGDCSNLSGNPAAAIEYSRVQYDGSAYSTIRDALRSFACTTGYGSSESGLNPGVSDGSDEGFVSKYQISGLTANDKLLRIRPLFNKASMLIKVTGSGVLPTQSYVVTSEGTAGDTKRTVQVEKSTGGLPSIFDYVLYNGSTTIPLQKE